MIDLHSHILPGIDDGAATLEQSVEMGELYAGAGFSRVVATPHFVPGTAWMPGKDIVEWGVEELNEVFEQKGIGVKVFAGMEIAMDGAIAGLFEQGRLCGLAGTSYVMVEAPFQQMPVGWEQVFTELSAKGCRVILAHPERCAQFKQYPVLFDDIISLGVYVQANYDSFLGGYGRPVEETALWLLEKGYVHCLATDSHDTVYRHPGRVKKALEVIGKTVGKEAAEIMARINPERVLADRNLKVPGPGSQGAGKKKWWKFF
ncbi:MAG: hypothetical protein K9J85_10575 [Desulfobacteraceae bacterium]|nr:hypothetical protein [Desulfobacteraceae bacterium]